MTLRYIACVVAFFAGLASAARGDDMGDEALPPAIGVLRFVTSAPDGVDVPDVASVLADRLATLGFGRVVSPNELGYAADSNPTPARIQEWGAAHDLQGIVVGRTAQVGRKISMAVRLRAVSDGAVVATYVEEVARAAEFATAVDRLAERLSGRIRAGVLDRPIETATSPNAAAGSGGAPEQPKKEEKKESGGGGGMFDRDRGPISIKSASLEAIDNQGQRKLVFTKNVRATQGDVTLRSNRLEAFYRGGSSQPERMVATGDVVVDQAGRRATCDTATFISADQRIFCRGNATMDEGCDKVSGDEIEIYLETERMLVRGDTRVHICAEGEGAGEENGVKPGDASNNGNTPAAEPEGPVPGLFR